MQAKSPIRVLLAEDDETMGYLLEDNLTTAGYQVDLCLDGQSALSAFFNRPYHLAILDVMLPKRDGFSVAAEIRRVRGKSSPCNPFLPFTYPPICSLNSVRMEVHWLPGGWPGWDC